MRIGGEFVFSQARVFPEYSPYLHEVPYREIPQDWTRYLAIDPGRQICAVLFAAVPPPGLPDGQSDEIWLYDELYMANCDAIMFGRNMQLKTQGQEFYAFIIDGNESRKAETGSGRTIEDQYGEQLQKNRVRSQLTGNGFVWGVATPEAGIEAVRPLLRMDQFGRVRLRVMVEKVPNFVWEIKHYKYKKIGKIITDKPESQKRVHQMANLRYLVQHGLEYHEPIKGQRMVDGVYRAFQRFRREAAEKSGASGSYMLGPGGQK